MRGPAIVLVLTSVLAFPVFAQGHGGTSAPPKPQGSPTFVAESSIPDGKAVIYIYRTGGSPLTLVNYVPLVLSKGGPLTILPAGSYYSYVTDPGTIRLWFSSVDSKDITVEAIAGQTYYVKVSYGANLLKPDFPPAFVELIPENKAKTENEILYCKPVK